MGIQFTAEQVIKMAPDASSASAGKKLAIGKHWKDLGQSEQALWGNCQGSALYRVKIDLSTLTIQCSCPSRKIPCKHGLGLLLLAVNSPATVPVTEIPTEIQEWLDKRAQTAKKKEEKQATVAAKPPSASQKKTAEKRQEQVRKGVEQLDLWLDDLIRNGLGALETGSYRVWETQAAQMIDAQAPGIATRIKNLSKITNASSNWTEKLLSQLGKLALLSEAYKRIDQLDAPLQEDVRQLMGWSLKEAEVLTQGEKVSDEWLVLGQFIEDTDRGRSQRTWLLGTQTGKQALLLQFSFMNAPFTEIYPVGSKLQGEVTYWPGVNPQRGLLATRQNDAQPIQSNLPGTDAIATFFTEVSTQLGQQPWRERFLCTLQQVTPVYEPSHNYWAIQDAHGHELPLNRQDHWKLLALSGGIPVDFAGEWNGETLTPLGIYAQQKYYAL